jgi:hypothetical protein
MEFLHGPLMYHDRCYILSLNSNLPNDEMSKSKIVDIKMQASIDKMENVFANPPTNN